jgi:hypothetical protein
MTIDPVTIELTPRQKDRLAEIAERTGKDCSTVVDELLDAVPLPQTDTPNGSGPKNLLEAMEAIGAIGCFDGPPDLSTNRKYMEGFGINASRRSSD